jgi:hypothetical protein
MENQSNTQTHTRVVKINNGYIVVKETFNRERFEEKRNRFNQRLLETAQKNYAYGND